MYNMGIMHHLFFSSTRALGSLFAPGMFSVMIVCVLVTVVALFGFIASATTLFAWIFQDPMFTWAGGVGAGVLAWFLFPGIMPVIVNFFGERIGAIIERQDYPAGLPARQPAFWPEFLHDVRFSLVTICLNLLVLPLYLLPVINLFLFYLLNGYLLGREFFVMAARRHMPTAEAEALRKRHGRTTLIAGIALTVLATIPIVNLFAPFWGIALMTHLFHRLPK